MNEKFKLQAVKQTFAQFSILKGFAATSLTRSGKQQLMVADVIKLYIDITVTFLIC